MPLSSENIRVRSAVPSDTHALTRLVFRAKAFWGYPKEWMEEWRKELTVTSDYVAQHRVVLAEQSFTWDELWQLNLNALEAAFLSEDEKVRHRSEWQAFALAIGK